MNMNKKIINKYDKKNIDWTYIEYLENMIKELKEENSDLLRQKHTREKEYFKYKNIALLESNDNEQLRLELQEKENEIKRYEKMNANLQHRLMFYKQSLL